MVDDPILTRDLVSAEMVSKQSWKVVGVEYTDGIDYPDVRLTLASVPARSQRIEGVLTHVAGYLESAGAFATSEKYGERYWKAYRATMAGVLDVMDTSSKKMMGREINPEERRKLEVAVHGWFGLDAEGREVK